MRRLLSSPSNVWNMRFWLLIKITMEKCRRWFTTKELIILQLKFFFKHPKVIFMSKKKKLEYGRKIRDEEIEKAKKIKEERQEEIRKRIKYYEWLEVRRILLEKWIIMCPKPPHSDKPENIDKIIKKAKFDWTWSKDIKEMLKKYEEIHKEDIESGRLKR